jgi:hypothetical protein
LPLKKLNAQLLKLIFYIKHLTIWTYINFSHNYILINKQKLNYVLHVNIGNIVYTIGKTTVINKIHEQIHICHFILVFYTYKISTTVFNFYLCTFYWTPKVDILL